MVGFVVTWFARDLDFPFFGWPFSFWVAAQGGIIVFVRAAGGLRAAHGAQRPPARERGRRGRRRLRHGALMAIRTRTFAPARSRLRALARRRPSAAGCTGSTWPSASPSSPSSAVMALLEQLGLSRRWIGFLFLVGPIVFYAGIGILSRTTDPTEYYVAGRRVPALYNGMATGADWMSAASFIGMAGTLYLGGYGGLAYILGWTGGFVPGGAADRALPAQVRPVHHPRLPRRALRRQPDARDRRRSPPSRARSSTWSRRSTAWA